MHSLIESLEKNQMKTKVTDVRSGDTVKVSQKIREGSKERVQVFEGLVIATRRQKSASSSITVRRIASGVGVEKTFLVHSPLVQKIEVVKRSKVRRDKLNYMKKRSGKSARLSAVAFDRDAVNAETEAESTDEQAEAAESKTEDKANQPKQEKLDEDTESKKSNDGPAEKAEDEKVESKKADEKKSDKSGSTETEEKPDKSE